MINSRLAHDRELFVCLAVPVQPALHAMRITVSYLHVDPELVALVREGWVSQPHIPLFHKTHVFHMSNWVALQISGMPWAADRQDVVIRRRPKPLGGEEVSQ